MLVCVRHLERGRLAAVVLEEPAGVLLAVEPQRLAADLVADYGGLVAAAPGLAALEQTGHQTHPGTPLQGHAFDDRTRQ